MARASGRAAVSSRARVGLPKTAWRFVYWRWYAAKECGLWLCHRLVPARMVPRHVDLSSVITLGITTYVMRYERFFIPLLRKLCMLCPEVRIVVTINGYHDAEMQEHYVARVKRDWAKVANATFVLHRQPRGLARLWNEIVSLAQTEHVFILNDDLLVTAYLRRWLEGRFWVGGDFWKINGTWSHFIISKNCFDRVGPFDEGFVGIGFEDADYEARMALAGREVASVGCRYLKHVNEMPRFTSYEKLGASIWGKYTERNREFFMEKWDLVDEESGAAVYWRPLGKYMRAKRPLRSHQVTAPMKWARQIVALPGCAQFIDVGE